MLLLRFFGEEKTRRHGRNMDEKKKRNRHVALIVLILLLGIANGKRLQDRSAHIKRYAEMPTAGAAETKAAETTAAAGEESTAATLPEQDADAARVIDFAALKAKNPDVVAWLYVPGTDVNYPILYREADNEYYLRRDIDGREGSYDGVFLDGDDAPDFSKLQNLMYGHHMKNGTMFTPLVNFKKKSFFEAHQRVYLYTPEHTYILKPLAALYTDAGEDKRRIEFSDRREFNAYVDQMTKGCEFRDLPAEGIDKLFSFVTCSYEFNDARTILYCYEVDAAGNPVKPAAIEKQP